MKSYIVISVVTTIKGLYWLSVIIAMLTLLLIFFCRVIYRRRFYSTQAVAIRTPSYLPFDRFLYSTPLYKDKKASDHTGKSGFV